MRKLSMKKPGTPAIDDSRANGRAGVNVPGDGARVPEPGAAAGAAFDSPRGLPGPVAGGAAGVLP